MSELADDARVWTAPPGELSLGSAEVHVWAANLDAAPTILASLASILSSAELERAARFHFEHHRKRWLVGRGMLRAILGRYLHSKPAAIAFDYGPFGKPSLASTVGSGQLHFNLSHSENLALLAVTRAAPIGVDVERVRRLQDADDLVARFFSHREKRAFEGLPEEQKPAAFFNLWTRKEAWLKATGEGIAHSLHLVEVSFVPGEPARLLGMPPKFARKDRWHLYDVTPVSQFAGCVAVAGKHLQLQCWQWQAQLYPP